MTRPERPSKPHDLPQDIWDAASAVESAWSRDGSSISTRTLLADGIARAILAERTAQKERDAKIVIELSKPLDISTDQRFQTALFKSLDRAVEARGEAIADAIR